MHARISTVAFLGIDIVDVDVQVHLGGGVGAFLLVGLPDKTIAESRERVRAALAAIGLALPVKRITVNPSPADLHKEGSHYDLPIALGLMSAMGIFAPDQLDGHVAIGELALDGRLRAVAGVLPAAVAAGRRGRGVICPEACGGEAAWSAPATSSRPRPSSPWSTISRARRCWRLRCHAWPRRAWGCPTSPT